MPNTNVVAMTNFAPQESKMNTNTYSILNMGLNCLWVSMISNDMLTDLD
jgi:hypothetical protein